MIIILATGKPLEEFFTSEQETLQDLGNNQEDIFASESLSK